MDNVTSKSLELILCAVALISNIPEGAVALIPLIIKKLRIVPVAIVIDGKPVYWIKIGLVLFSN